MRGAIFVASLSLFILSTFETDAFAHTRLKVDGLIKPRSIADGLKTGPCGNVPRTNISALLAPGQTVDVEWEETIDHPGSFKFSFSSANDLGFETNLLKEIPDTQNSGPLPHLHKTSITLPNVTCSACTFQLIQVMTDSTPPTFYYSCADIQLVAADSAPPANVSSPTAVPGDRSTVLSWTNPVSDFFQTIVVQSSAPITALPTSGTLYAVGDAIGNGTVVYKGSINTTAISNLSNGQMYYFKFFSQSPRVFYSSGIEVSVIPIPINAAPNLTLQLSQSGRTVTAINTNGGMATVTATVIDPNPNDTHEFDWSKSTSTLIDLDTAPNTLLFDPSRTSPGSYTVVVQVTDNGLPSESTNKQLQFTVTSTAAVPAPGSTVSKTANRTGGGLIDFATWLLLACVLVARIRPIQTELT